MTPFPGRREPDRTRDGALVAVLREAQVRGYLGRGPVEDHIRRALDLAVATNGAPRHALDLGTGGGIPGLPLALHWPESTWLLLDGSTSRAAFLTEILPQLGLEDRVSVLDQRAEEAGRGPLRATFDLVVARSFAAPAVTAECAAPFLAVGGTLVVAEPPGGAPARWDEPGLAKLGLSLGESLVSPTACQVMRQDSLCPAGYPRRVGVPAKRPLF